MQSVSSRIWTRVAVSISYDDNDYTTGTSCVIKKGTQHDPDLQNWSLTIKCSLVPYPGHLFF